MPAGYRIETAGDSAKQQQAINQLLTYVPVLATLMIGALVLSGGDFWPPLAIVIAGGVGLSAMLSLFFTPAAYQLIQRVRFLHTGMLITE